MTSIAMPSTFALESLPEPHLVRIRNLICFPVHTIYRT